MSKKSDLEKQVEFDMRALGVPAWEREYKFCPTRKWRLDFAWPDRKLALEVEGKGHEKWNRYHSDMEKYNAAALDGWTLLRVSWLMIKEGRHIQVLEAIVGTDA